MKMQNNKNQLKFESEWESSDAQYVLYWGTQNALQSKNKPSPVLTHTDSNFNELQAIKDFGISFNASNRISIKNGDKKEITAQELLDECDGQNNTK